MKQQGGGTLVLPEGGVCVFDGEAFLKSTSGLIIEGNGATLKTAPSQPANVAGNGILRFEDSSNLVFRNVTLDGNRANRTGIEEKRNDLLLLRASSDVLVSNVRALNSVADGFYLRGNNIPDDGNDVDTERIRLVNCRAENSYRHGISLVKVKEIQIRGGAYTNSNGSLNDDGDSISTGVRIAPNDDLEYAIDVLVQGVTISDNEGAGIHMHEPTDSTVDGIRILGNTFRRNQRSHLRLRGSNILVHDNFFEDFDFETGVSEDAVAFVRTGTRGISFADNVFTNLETEDLDVIQVETGVEDLAITDNHFKDVNLSAVPTSTGATAPTIIRTDAVGSMITGNTFEESNLRAILIASDAERSLVSGNRFSGMDRNVIYVNADETRIANNTISTPRATSAGSGKAEAVIRVRSDLGTAEGNAIECVNTTQRGFLFEKGPVLVTDNVARACSSTLWLSVEGTPKTTPVHNLRYTVP